jgi:hypothetical protein
MSSLSRGVVENLRDRFSDHLVAVALFWNAFTSLSRSLGFNDTRPKTGSMAGNPRMAFFEQLRRSSG